MAWSAASPDTAGELLLCLGVAALPLRYAENLWFSDELFLLIYARLCLAVPGIAREKRPRPGKAQPFRIAGRQSRLKTANVSSPAVSLVTALVGDGVAIKEFL